MDVPRAEKDALMVSFMAGTASIALCARENAGFSVVGHPVSQNYHRRPHMWAIATNAPTSGKGVTSATKPAADVLGWKYSGNRHHPTEKPVTSLQPLIESLHPNAIVLDRLQAAAQPARAPPVRTPVYIGIECWRQSPCRQQRLAAVQRAMQQGRDNNDWFMPEAA